jgi:DNA (cytosine-5)-methyltransferase 1
MNFTFIDLFAGIGGFRKAFEQEGGKCVFSSEWDKYSQKTYEANFGEKPQGDITKIDSKHIPNHDILLGGFPCQPFSIAGVSKKVSLGMKHGFEDKKQGNLFFEIARILGHKKPRAFLLENVKNLKSHDKGKTFKTIEKTLDDLGYKVFAGVVDAKNYVPQHRERIFLVGFQKRIYPDIDFYFPEPPSTLQRIGDILDENVDERYVLSNHLWKYLQDYAEKHRQEGNGFGFGIIDPQHDIATRTLSARYYKDGSEILVKQKGKNPRRLTPRECARLMGFDEDFKIVVSDTQAYRQFGNAVVVPVVQAIARQMLDTMAQYRHSHNKTSLQTCSLGTEVNSSLPVLCHWR